MILLNKGKKDKFTAAAIGAGIGALAGAAAAVLTDEKNRKKIGIAVNQLKEKISKNIKEAQKETEEKIKKLNK